MASPIETPARAPGFGAKRWIVQGVNYGPEPEFALLRGRINEYPERVPLTPAYPLAGRRGGSRPRAQVLAEGVTAVVPPGLYPTARVRDPNALQGITTGLTPAQISAIGNPRGLGFPRTHFLSVATTVTAVLATVPLPGPAIITRIEVQTDQLTISPNVNIGFRYSTDDNTTGGFGTSGSRFFLAGVAAFDIIMGLDRMVWTPNVLVPHSTWFLKMIVLNNQAGTINVLTSYSVEWL